MLLKIFWNIFFPCFELCFYFLVWTSNIMGGPAISRILQVLRPVMHLKFSRWLPGNTRVCLRAGEKIGSCDSIFDLINSTYFLKIINYNQHASTIKYLANMIKKYVSTIRNWQVLWCAAHPASACRLGGRHLQKFAWGCNLALFFEAVQSRPISTTFPKSWHNYPEQYFSSFAQWIELSPCISKMEIQTKLRHKQIAGDLVWIREAFLSHIIISIYTWGHRWVSWVTT